MERLTAEQLDPGIRETVEKLRGFGFRTTDSGDGVSKPAEHRALDIPHVFIVVDPEQMAYEARRCKVALGDGWVVEASFSTAESVSTGRCRARSHTRRPTS